MIGYVTSAQRPAAPAKFYAALLCEIGAKRSWFDTFIPGRCPRPPGIGLTTPSR